MAETKTKTNTLKIARVIKAPRERVYNAFLDSDQLAKWLPPGGFTGHFDKMEPRVGGSWHGSFTAIDTKATHHFGGRFIELNPHERIVKTDRFDTDAPGMQGEMTVTVTLEQVSEGTKLTILQENIPAAIPAADAKVGWGQSLENLARLVEV